jgi:alpha-N-arabinofuranosidase
MQWETDLIGYDAMHSYGSPSYYAQVQLISLSATNPEETNTVTDPEHIIPVERPMKDVSAGFTHTLPPYSIQVIEIHAK